MTKRTKLTRRRFLTATGGAAAAAALAGCSGQPNGGDEGTDDKSKNGKRKVQNKVDSPNPDATLHEINSTLTTLDPIASTGTADGVVIRQLFDALMDYPDGRSEVKPLLATEYKLSDDKKTYTFTLKDAKYHNGKSVTADDFVYSYERLAASKNSKRAYFLTEKLGIQHETKTITKKGKETQVYVPNSMAVKAVDEKTLEVTLQQQFHSTLAMLAYSSFSAVPKGIVGDIQGVNGEMKYDEFASKNPIGSGPFKFKKWGGGEVEVERFDDYHGGKPSIGGVHWAVIEKDDPQFKYSMNKNADIFPIPTSKYKPDLVTVDDSTQTDFGGVFGHYGKAENDEYLNYYRITPLVIRYLGFNMANVPKPVRQAFAYATNQKQLVEQLFKGRGKQATHITPPNIFPGGKSGYEEHAKKYPYDATAGKLDKAKQVMEEAGYSKDKRFSITLTRYQSQAYKKVVGRLQKKLRNVYIDVKLNPTDFATMTRKGRNGQLDVYTLGWIADWPAADNFVQLINPPQTDTSKQGPVSYINWTEKNGSEAKKATDAFKRIAQNKQPTEEAKKIREEAYIAMEEANWEDVGFLPLYHDWAELFWYDWVEYPAYGVMGNSRKKRNNVKIGKNQP